MKKSQISKIIGILTLCLGLSGVGQPIQEKQEQDVVSAQMNVPVLSDLKTVVPSGVLPDEVDVQNANNNLDIVWHEDRFFLAFRTAPKHFASDAVQLYVISTNDPLQDPTAWRFETVIFKGTDLREPRLLSWNGRLFLYFAVLGTNPADFEPQGMMVIEYLGPGNWSSPEWFYEPGFIPWRTKTIEGIPYMLTYVGGENIYDVEGGDIEVHWLTTSDGRNWVPVVPNQPVVLKGGCSETDFVFLDDGSLLSVCRNEKGDADGWGSKICKAPADSLGEWRCVSDPRKYDSPLLFKHGEQVYLIGRRNVTKTGNYDLGYDRLSPQAQTLLYEARYWFQPKRCSLWQVDAQTLSVSFVLDFPSRGDTCFPGWVALTEQSYLIYNYTSPLDGDDVAWVKGQLGPTSIYQIILSMP